MLPGAPSLHGDHLFGLLPEIYRERDREPHAAHAGHLREYLSAHGLLLDRLRQTLEQLHADHFPDAPADGGRLCQDWVIPYLADLVGATLVSPFANGQRAEAAKAVRWAKAKGTLTAAAEIAEAVTQSKAELQEGFARLIRTTVPGEPAHAHGTIDLRLPSRAAAAPPPKGWRQLNPGGAPCFPGSYEDVSPRTVDLRDPDAAARQGRYHPKRLLIYLPPPAGFFPPSRLAMAMPADGDWDGEGFSPNKALKRTISSKGVLIENATPGAVEITGPVAAGPATAFANLIFSGTVSFNAGDARFTRCAINHLAFGAAADDRRLVAASSLFDTVSGGIGLADLEYCTILSAWTAAAKIRASEVIFPDGFDASKLDCARFSSVPPAARPRYLSSTFGTAGCAVLAQDADPALITGAEDGGELGCFHDWRFAAMRAALVAKLADYLPMGISSAVIWDARLLAQPPAIPPPRTSP